jgi:hypothetical protein
MKSELARNLERIMKAHGYDNFNLEPEHRDEPELAKLAADRDNAKKQAKKVKTYFPSALERAKKRLGQ